MAVDGENSGSLGPSGRFQRIEESLLRIEAKLDAKLDNIEFLAYQGRMAEWAKTQEHRVGDLEKGETPMAKILLRQFDGLLGDVTSLKEAQKAGVTLAQFRRWLLGMVVAVAGVLTSVVWLVANHK